MPADFNTPLFGISDGDNIEYEDDPAITQVKANLTVAERVQQERAKQRRLEREEWKVWVEVERLTWEIEEVDQGPGIVIPKKNCMRCVMWETLCLWDLEGCTRSCRLCRQLKKLCRRFEGPSEKGNWRAEDEGEGEGLSKRPRVRPVSEQMEWRWMEVKDPQVGS